MTHSQDTDSKYIGQIRHSIECLPQWYQILALSGFFLVIYLRDNNVVSWLVANLHNSFGTERIWSPGYTATLEQMTFNERLFFTLYGIFLLLVNFFLYKMCCTDSYGVGSSVAQLLPDRRRCTVVLWVLMCGVEALRLREETDELFQRRDSLASIALHGLSGVSNTETTGHFSMISSSNAHFVIQVEVGKMYLGNMLVKRFPVILCAGLFRIGRDMPSCTHAALRYYFVTVALFIGAAELATMSMSSSWHSLASWALVSWTLLVSCIINFIYGPTKRAGTVATVCASKALIEALRGLLTCAGMWVIASMTVLTVVTGMHVVELLLVWLLFSLLIIWIPAVVDACAVEYILLLTFAICVVGYRVGILTADGSLRFGTVVAVWWFDLCLVYNVTTNLFRTRYAGIGAALWFFWWIIAPPRDVYDTSEPLGVRKMLRYRVDDMLQTANLDSTAANADELKEAFHGRLKAGITLSIVLVATASAIGRIQSTEVKARLRRAAIPLASPSTICSKAVRTAALIACVAPALATYYIFRLYVIPQIMLLPHTVSRWISWSAACIVLGELMDVKGTIVMIFLRLVGAADPPMTAEDVDEQSSDDDKMSTLSG